MPLAIFTSIGVPELLIVLVILLVILGPKRLPALGRQLGGGFREFKDSVTRKADDDDGEEPRTPAALTPGQPAERRDAEGEVVSPADKV